VTAFAELPPALELLLGSAGDFDVWLFDQNDAPEDLSDVDDAVFTVRDGPSALEPLLELGDPDVVVVVADSKLVCTVSQAVADQLVAGLFVGDAALHFASDDVWKHTDPVAVRIRATYSTHP